MGIDYVLDLDCSPKRALGTEAIVDMVKHRSRAEAMLEVARKGGDTRPPEALTFDVVLQTPSGTTKSKVSVKELFDRAAPLDAHRPACAACPANRGAPGFGCYRSIPYPIPTRVEEWLLMRLPDELEGTLGGIMLGNALRDFGWDGAQAAGMRARAGTFFEASTPASVQWGDVKIDANQVFHMMFSLGPLAPSHAMMLALFFGVIPHDTPPEAMKSGARRAEVLRTAAVPSQDDPAMESMAQFLRTLPLAAQLDVKVLIDA